MMSIYTNYERVSICVNNQKTLDFVYTIKMYLENIIETKQVKQFYLECDGQPLESYENLEDYQMINFIINYVPECAKDSIDFYTEHCKDFRKDEVRVFGISNDGKPQFYTYNGYEIATLPFGLLTSIDDKYQCFEAEPMSLMFELPNHQNQDDLKHLMKQWAELGTTFYEECVDEEQYDGYYSYLVEPTYHMNRHQLTQMIELYNTLIDYLKEHQGRIISVQPLLVAHHPSADLVLKVEKNNVGLWCSDPFFYPMYN